MILYHISKDIFTHKGVFTPRIPYQVLDSENCEIPRICVSANLEGCLSSMPSGGTKIAEDGLGIGLYKVFVIDTEKLGIYEIISPKELWEDRLVQDAELSDEYWITESFSVPEEDSYIMYLTNYDVSIDLYETFAFEDDLVNSQLDYDDFIESDDFDEDVHYDNFYHIHSLEYRKVSMEEALKIREDEDDEDFVA